MPVRRSLRYAFLIVAAVMASAVPALADPPPVPIDMTAPLTDLDGRPVPDPASRERGDITADCRSCKSLDLGHAIAYSLCQDTPDERGRPGGDHLKYERCKLGSRLLNDKAAIIAPEDLKRIKAAVEAHAQGIVVLRVTDLLDLAEKK